jgi:hypothetical protein
MSLPLTLDTDAAPGVITLAHHVCDGVSPTTTFGEIRFWGFAAVQPHDQAYVIAEVRVHGECLDLWLRHASGLGQPFVLSIEAPGAIEVSADALTLDRAARLVLGDSAAWPDGPGRYAVSTPRGQGSFDQQDRPALTLRV